MKSKKEFKDLPFLRVSKPFIFKYGHDAACLIEELAYWQEQMKKKKDCVQNDGYFFYEQYKIQHATGLTKHKQDKAVKILQKEGFLKIFDRKLGIPPKTHYKIDIDAYKNSAISAYDEYQAVINEPRSSPMTKETKIQKTKENKKDQKIGSPYRIKNIFKATVPSYIDEMMSQEEIDELRQQELPPLDVIDADIYEVTNEFNPEEILMELEHNSESLDPIH